MSDPGLPRRAFAPLGRLLDFGGRTPRDEFWPYMLLLVAIYGIGAAFAFALVPWRLGSPVAHMYGLTAALMLLAFAAVVRRLHDVGWSGRWMAAYALMALAFIGFFFHWRYGLIHSAAGTPPVSLIRIAPILMPFMLAMNGIALLIFVICLLEGTAGANRYGPDPTGRSAP